jgi:hypothetical protein
MMPTVTDATPTDQQRIEVDVAALQQQLLEYEHQLAEMMPSLDHANEGNNILDAHALVW